MRGCTVNVGIASRNLASKCPGGHRNEEVKHGWTFAVKLKGTEFLKPIIVRNVFS